eukprot:366363-Chlamydomonas_euryale.AAC.6
MPRSEVPAAGPAVPAARSAEVLVWQRTRSRGAARGSLSARSGSRHRSRQLAAAAAAWHRRGAVWSAVPAPSQRLKLGQGEGLGPGCAAILVMSHERASYRHRRRAAAPRAKERPARVSRHL